MFTGLSFCISLFFAQAVSASLTTPGDGPYSTLHNQRTLYIFDRESGEVIDQVAAYSAALQSIYERSFNWRLDDRLELLLLSPRQQIANAYATVQPNLKTVWYPSGAALLEEFAESSWFLTLASHEIAHLYQLNAKAPLPANLKKVFGSPMLIFPFIPIFIHPNIFAPAFMLEGNAVLNESRLNMGGRLHSGEERALVLAQIKAGEIDANRLINDQFRFPFGDLQYLQGGYFNAHLAAKYGVERTNSFFLKQSENFIFPLILNRTFREHFGASYPQEIREYTRTLELQARQQTETESAPVIVSTFVGPMNHDDQRIWFLTDDGIQPPVLRVFYKHSGQWQSRSVDLLRGKVFSHQDQWWSAGSFPHNLYQVEHSLYGEGLQLNERYRGQIVTDIRGGRTAALDGRNAWLEPKLLLDGEPYDIGHSNPVLDPQGQIHYFRQNGTVRVLFRQREPVFKYDGFYGKLTEVDSDGAVYFIANTEFGASLYRYNKNEIVRLLRSDRVIDARKISTDEFLVTEITTSGHEIHILKAQPSNISPAFYSYGFSTESLFPKPTITPDEVRQQQKPYSQWGSLRFSALEFLANANAFSGLGATTLARFNDPLEFHNVNIGYSFQAQRPNPQQALASYTLTRYLPDFSLRYLYSERLRENGNQIYSGQEAFLGVLQPLLRWRRWDAKAQVDALYENTEDQTLTAEETYGVQSSLLLQYQFAPGLGMQPWRAFQLRLKNRLESQINEWTKKENASLLEAKAVYGFASEFYLSTFGALAWAEDQDVAVEYNPLGFSERIALPLLTSDRNYVIKTGGILRMEFEKVINTPAYSPRIPLGLNRISPFVVGQLEFFDDDPLNRYPTQDFEYGWGLNMDVMLLHQLHVPFRFLVGFSTRYPNRTNQELTVNYRSTF